jgi:uncharacterized membrane protein YdbT with pleckstrin-like domain
MGSYVNRNLISGEQVVYQTSYHWIIFFNLRALLSLFLNPLIAKWTDEFVITNKRIIMKTGLIAVKTLELNLSKVESVKVNQSVIGRILGFGHVVIIGTGGTQETFVNIRKPSEFRKKFQENT